jgi:nucleotide-binding universal stress UspA family protein
MSNAISPGPVVVAVDGSNAAIGAAEWAAREALHHDVPLRLVHVIDTSGGASFDRHSIDYEYAETCLRAADLAIKLLGVHVQVDTAVLRGEIASTLIAESEGATLICLGSTGIGRVAAAVLGSTAATVAEGACCAVAIIRRTRDRPPPQTGFIAVVLDDGPGNEEAMRWAMEEARIRHAPVLALGAWSRPLFHTDYERFDRQLHDWLQRYPDVTVEIATTRMSPIRYLQDFVGALQLVIISSDHATQVAKLIGPHSLSILVHADSSVLVAREPVQTTDPPGGQRASLDTEAVAL